MSCMRTATKCGYLTKRQRFPFDGPPDEDNSRIRGEYLLSPRVKADSCTIELAGAEVVEKKAHSRAPTPFAFAFALKSIENAVIKSNFRPRSGKGS